MMSVKLSVGPGRTCEDGDGGRRWTGLLSGIARRWKGRRPHADIACDDVVELSAPGNPLEGRVRREDIHVAPEIPGTRTLNAAVNDAEGGRLLWCQRW